MIMMILMMIIVTIKLWSWGSRTRSGNGGSLPLSLCLGFVFIHQPIFIGMSIYIWRWWWCSSSWKKNNVNRSLSESLCKYDIDALMPPDNGFHCHYWSNKWMWITSDPPGFDNHELLWNFDTNRNVIIYKRHTVKESIVIKLSSIPK